MKTKIVGICNVTPDSFSDGGLHLDPEKAIEHIRRMFDEGADIVDIGAESTRPGATPVGEYEEWERLKPVIERLGELGLLDKVSVDTMKYQPAVRSLIAGVAMINDVSGDFYFARDLNSQVGKGWVKHEFMYVMTCIPGRTPAEAHKNPYTGDLKFLIELIRLMYWDLVIEAGYGESRLVVDPGIGFGKRPELSMELLGIATDLQNIPVMIGYSNKRFLEKVGLTNLEAGRIAIESGAAYLRVHDVASHVSLRDQLGGS